MSSLGVGVQDRRGPRAWLARHWLFVLIALTYAYFFQGSDPNQTTRTLLTKALVERHTPDITPEAARTIDKGYFRGKYYSDKAPGVALVATIPYALMSSADRVFHLDAGSRAVERARMHMLTITTSGVAGAIAAFFLFRLLLLFGSTKGQAELLTLGYAFGTLAFPFSTVMFGHQTAAAILTGAFYLLIQTRMQGDVPSAPRLALIGGLLASSVAIEYPTGMLVVAMGVYTLTLATDRQSLLRIVGFLSVGAAGPILLHSAFLYWCYGSPFSLPYKHVSEPIFVAHVSTGLLGIGIPTKVGAFGSLLSRYRGLFFYCPLLILTPLGFRAWILEGKWRRELVLSGVLIVTYLIFCASYYAWDGGGSTGPRHLVPVMPFFILPLGFLLRRHRYALAGTATFVIPSVVIMTACVACIVQLPEGDVDTFDPLYEFVLPSILHDQIALNMQDLTFAPLRRADASYNLGLLFHLSPKASIAFPFLVWGAALGARFVHRMKKQAAR